MGPLRMNDAVAHALDLQPLADGRYRATSLGDGHGGVVVGGQVMAQALVAAARTFPDKEVLSIHAVFARGASPAEPLELIVDTVHEGRSFASATVSVSQADRVCTQSVVLLHHQT